jgi:lauroyl/myristoyl acyltransferase
MFDSLKRGEVVTFLVDRYIMGASTEVPFFGEPARMPTGPMSLAQKSGSPVLMAYSWREGPGKWYGGFTPLDITPGVPSGSSDTATGSASASIGGHQSRVSTPTATRVRGSELAGYGHHQFLQAFERVIEQHPEQWVAALAPIWDTNEGGSLDSI